MGCHVIGFRFDFQISVKIFKKLVSTDKKKKNFLTFFNRQEVGRGGMTEYSLK